MGLPVIIAEDPLSCVALGTGRALEEAIFPRFLCRANAYKNDPTTVRKFFILQDLIQEAGVFIVLF